MLTPYQSIQKCGNVLIAACISRLDSFSLEDGSLLSSWTFPALRNNSLERLASGEVYGKLVALDTDSLTNQHRTRIRTVNKKKKALKQCG
jgi:hypothetical protein